MALLGLLVPTHFSISTRLSIRTSRGGRSSKIVECMAVKRLNSDETMMTRRSADYHAPIWEYNYLQSLTSNYVGEIYKRRASKLKEDVRKMFDKVEEPLSQLELIDTMQRLGLSYHYEVEIKRILESIYNDNSISDGWKRENLYATSLQFRLLRQHGYDISQDVFNSFKDEFGNFKTCLCEDTKGMLYLYEASYLSTWGESLLDEARNFTTKQLKENLKKMDERSDNSDLNENIAILVSHALELPLHWRMLRLEARWFIDVYERRQDMNVTLLEFAKLDFNIVQAAHQEDLKHMSRWWKSTCLGDKLSFARDRLMENFFWTVGDIFEPKFHYCRRMITKLNSLITTIDDVYDVYGTLEELELFTNVVERWDINAIEQLPNYMKLCFLALYNSINEMAYDALTEHDSYILSYLKNTWADLCKCYLLEAKWYHNRYTPTLDEYMKNASISIGGPLTLVHAYFAVTNSVTNEALECSEKYPNIIRYSSMIVRLSNDLGTSPHELKRGDNPKSVQCYMHETGSSEDDAREHIKFLISETWKKMNEDIIAYSPFDKTFIGIAMNLARMGQCMYQNGDGHGIEDVNINLVRPLLINHIPLI